MSQPQTDDRDWAVDLETCGTGQQRNLFNGCADLIGPVIGKLGMLGNKASFFFVEAVG